MEIELIPRMAHTQSGTSIHSNITSMRHTTKSAIQTNCTPTKKRNMGWFLVDIWRKPLVILQFMGRNTRMQLRLMTDRMMRRAAGAACSSSPSWEPVTSCLSSYIREVDNPSLLFLFGLVPITGKLSWESSSILLLVLDYKLSKFKDNRFLLPPAYLTIFAPRRGHIQNNWGHSIFFKWAMFFAFYI